MSSNQAPTFRYPFVLTDQPKNVQDAHVWGFNAIQDLQQAIASLKGQLTTVQNAVSTINKFTTSNTSGGNAFPNLGTVNDQLGNTLYLTQQTDNGALIVLGDSSPVTLRLNSTVAQPYFAWIANLDSTSVTISPTSGHVNNASSFILVGFATTEVFYQGSDWWATLETGLRKPCLQEDSYRST